MALADFLDLPIVGCSRGATSLRPAKIFGIRGRIHTNRDHSNLPRIELPQELIPMAIDVEQPKNFQMEQHEQKYSDLREVSGNRVATDWFRHTADAGGILLTEYPNLR